MKKSVIVVVCLLLVGIFGWSIAKANSADIKILVQEPSLWINKSWY